VPEPVIVRGLKEQLTPLGRPEQDSAKLLLKPPAAVIVTVELADSGIGTDDGDSAGAEIWKSPCIDDDKEDPPPQAVRLTIRLAMQISESQKNSTFVRAIPFLLLFRLINAWAKY
jgi:hypothetical protein